MKQAFTPAVIAKRSALAMVGLVLVATIDVASASTSTGSAGYPARLASQPSVRLAETVAVTKSKKNVKKSGNTWLNPQPEPPSPASKSGGTWLNPQPEPPRPDTGSKNLR